MTSMLTRRSLLKTAGSFPLLSLPTLSGPALAQNTSVKSNGLGIILVGASWCPYCHAAAKQLGVASQQWGWPVIVAALDNVAIDPFEHVLDASTHPLTKDVQRLPTTLIVNPKDDHIVFAFEGFRGPVPYLSQIANTFEAWEEQEKEEDTKEEAGEGAHG